MRQLYYVPLYSNSRDEIIDKCINVLERGKKFIYILPSREAIFDVRNKFIDKYGGLIGTSSIFSFDNLEKEIVGYDSNMDIIDTETIAILIKSLCKELKENGKLKFFNNVIDKNGFIQETYKIIKSLKRQNILPKDFKKFYIDLYNEIDILQFKLKCDDLFEIYNAYSDTLKNKHLLDIDDISYLAVEKTRVSNIFHDVELFIVDGYINIDTINKVLFEEILKIYPNIHYIFNIPYKNNNNQGFIEKEMINWLDSMNFEKVENNLQRVDVENDLMLLSENLFSQNIRVIDTSNSIRILNAPCIENELRQVARVIKNKFLNNETIPEKIAVFANNIQEYEEYIEDIFCEFGIPAGISFKQSLLSQPVIKDILDVLKLDGQIEKLINIVSSKYLIDIKYAKERSINTEKFINIIEVAFNKNDLIGNINNIIEQFDLEKYDFAQKDAVFVRDFLTQIYSFKKDSEANLTDYIEWVKSLISKLQIRHNIINLYREGLVTSDVFIRDIKALDLFEKSLEKVRSSYKFCGLEGQKVYRTEFIEILEEFLNNKSIVKSEGSISGVKIISPDLARGQYYDYVFILGVNEGKYPNISQSVLFDDFQSKMLFNKSINFNNYDYELKREKIRFNLVCSSAQKGFCISYRTSDEENGYMIKSAFLEELEGLFTETALKSVLSSTIYMRDRFCTECNDISTINEVRDSIISSIWQTDEQTLSELLKFNGVLNNYENDFKYINYAGKVEFSRMLNPEFDQFDGKLDNPALKQNSSDYIFSASQINDYVKCPFGYFMKKVLDMDTFEDDGELSAVNEGKIYHKVLKDYYKNCKNIYELDEKLLEVCIDDTFKAINNTVLNHVIFEARKNEIEEVLKTFIKSDASYLEGYLSQTGNKLKPEYLEDIFSDNITFAKGKFKGAIDRVDIEYNQDNQPTGRFVIYDYKRNSTSSLTSCIKGEDFQLAIYYYCLVKKLENQYKIKNPECISLLYYSIEKNSKEGFIRKDYKNQLGLGSKRNVIAQDKFFIVMEHLKNWIENIIENIQNGEFIIPYECDPQYCSYSSICRYDKYRVLGKSR